MVRVIEKGLQYGMRWWAFALAMTLAGCETPISDPDAEKPYVPLKHAGRAPVILANPPKTGEIGPVSAPNENGITVQAVDAHGKGIIILRMRNEGRAPATVFVHSRDVGFCAEITSVSAEESDEEPNLIIDQGYSTGERETAKIPVHGSIDLLVECFQLPNNVRRGTYIAEISYGDWMLNRFADSKKWKGRSTIGNTKSARVVLYVPRHGAFSAKPIL